MDRACTSLGVTLRAGRVVHHQKLPLRRVSNAKSKPTKHLKTTPNQDVNVSQATIDTEAREAIRDLFPNIPNEDLYTIIRQAFDKVGRCGLVNGVY